MLSPSQRVLCNVLVSLGQRDTLSRRQQLYIAVCAATGAIDNLISSMASVDSTDTEMAATLQRICSNLCQITTRVLQALMQSVNSVAEMANTQHQDQLLDYFFPLATHLLRVRVQLGSNSNSNNNSSNSLYSITEVLRQVDPTFVQTVTSFFEARFSDLVGIELEDGAHCHHRNILLQVEQTVCQNAQLVYVIFALTSLRLLATTTEEQRISTSAGVFGMNSIRKVVTLLEAFVAQTPCTELRFEGGCRSSLQMRRLELAELYSCVSLGAVHAMKVLWECPKTREVLQISHHCLNGNEEMEAAMQPNTLLHDMCASTATELSDTLFQLPSEYPQTLHHQASLLDIQQFYTQQPFWGNDSADEKNNNNYIMTSDPQKRLHCTGPMSLSQSTITAEFEASQRFYAVIMIQKKVLEDIAPYLERLHDRKSNFGDETDDENNQRSTDDSAEFQEQCEEAVFVATSTPVLEYLCWVSETYCSASSNPIFINGATPTMDKCVALQDFSMNGGSKTTITSECIRKNVNVKGCLEKVTVQRLQRYIAATVAALNLSVDMYLIFTEPIKNLSASSLLVCVTMIPQYCQRLFKCIETLLLMLCHYETPDINGSSSSSNKTTTTPRQQIQQKQHQGRKQQPTLLAVESQQRQNKIASEACFYRSLYFNDQNVGGAEATNTNPPPQAPLWSEIVAVPAEGWRLPRTGSPTTSPATSTLTQRKVFTYSEMALRMRLLNGILCGIRTPTILTVIRRATTNFLPHLSTSFETSLLLGDSAAADQLVELVCQGCARLQLPSFSSNNDNSVINTSVTTNGRPSERLQINEVTPLHRYISTKPQGDTSSHTQSLPRRIAATATTSTTILPPGGNSAQRDSDIPSLRDTVICLEGLMHTLQLHANESERTSANLAQQRRLVNELKEENATLRREFQSELLSARQDNASLCDTVAQLRAEALTESSRHATETMRAMKQLEERQSVIEQLKKELTTVQVRLKRQEARNQQIVGLLQDME